jgi:hypothetical protein
MKTIVPLVFALMTLPLNGNNDFMQAILNLKEPHQHQRLVLTDAQKAVLRGSAKQLGQAFPHLFGAKKPEGFAQYQNQIIRCAVADATQNPHLSEKQKKFPVLTALVTVEEAIGQVSKVLAANKVLVVIKKLNPSYLKLLLTRDVITNSPEYRAEAERYQLQQ